MADWLWLDLLEPEPARDIHAYMSRRRQKEVEVVIEALNSLDDDELLDMLLGYAESAQA